MLTCVYCGLAYPDGTPPHGSAVLTDHIKVCDKHPMREAETKIKLLRSALVGLVGTDGRDELERHEAAMRLVPAPAADKASGIDAIRALLATLPEPPKEQPEMVSVPKVELGNIRFDASQLCLKIEAAGCSELLTELSVIASEIHQRLQKLVPNG